MSRWLAWIILYMIACFDSRVYVKMLLIYVKKRFLANVQYNFPPNFSIEETLKSLLLLFKNILKYFPCKSDKLVETLLPQFQV